jgi:thiamine-monophosphate kinase
MSGEDAITQWFADKSRLSAEEFPIGIGDDMAQVRLGDESVLVTTDMLLDGVHFDLASAGIEQVGYKAMAVSLSDCAAMASRPICAVVSVGLPKGFGEGQLKELHSGIVRAGEKYGCWLVGGDITSWKGAGKFCTSVTMLSRPAEGVMPVRRSGAKAGDVICVTGALGGSGKGMHLTFEPRVFEAIEIASLSKINSMIDLSDGLSSDLWRICEQSRVGAVIYSEKIPISEAARDSVAPIEAALNDGEDFELLFTIAEDEYKKLIAQWKGETPITEIGRITDSRIVQIEEAGGEIRELARGGYDHLG